MPQPWRCSPTTLRAPCIPRPRALIQHAVEAWIPQWGVSPPGGILLAFRVFLRKLELIISCCFHPPNVGLDTTCTDPDWMLRQCGLLPSSHAAFPIPPHCWTAFAMIAGKRMPFLSKRFAVLPNFWAVLPAPVLGPLSPQNLLLLGICPAAPRFRPRLPLQ